MEGITAVADAARFDEVLRSCPPEHGDIEFVFKNAVTRSGAGGVLITFTVTVDGKPLRVQAVTTAKCLLMAAAAVEGFVRRNPSQN